MIETILAIIHLALALWAIINIFGAKVGLVEKLLWLVLVLVLPLIGLIIWYFAGPKSA
ncbi:hypothetical protein GCM10008090_15300 [Arenicella chitinivorans]|uniref:Cardiolipin synthase N-terminal domain-containing protein n=1 Tax=Arenicella chitinivorans TaxID=1329800 RepID=A0A918RNA4_9GAMM|nr:PLDc N-terminal domain-containing protein [Arenicella chitinivorans]GHA06567.1 hypothetical protein GCM10008090_15300 [Arenicella chitinivorans]